MDKKISLNKLKQLDREKYNKYKLEYNRRLRKKIKENPELYEDTIKREKETNRLYYERNKEKIKFKQQELYPRYKEKQKEYKETVKGRFIKYVYRSKRKGYTFKLTLEKFAEITAQPCIYCGYDKKPVGIDRQDNRQGYTPENSVPCCWPCNRLKGRRSKEEFINLIEKFGKMYERMKSGA